MNRLNSGIATEKGHLFEGIEMDEDNSGPWFRETSMAPKMIPFGEPAAV